MPALNQKASSENREEPWLRGTLTEVPAVPRAVLHALELAREDIERWCAGLSDEEITARPQGLGSVAFHILHIANSTDRLLTYAEGRELTPDQFAAAKAEIQSELTVAHVVSRLREAFDRSAMRVRALALEPPILEQPRTVGRKRLPTTVGGLLVHVADHTQRHVGQAVLTAKLVIATRNEKRSSEPNPY
jgi:uncharacterized damage-inducible protein DinB